VQATMLWHQLLFLSMFVGPMIGSLVVQVGISPFHAMLIGGGLRLIGAVVAIFGVAWLDNQGRKQKRKNDEWSEPLRG